METYKYHDLSTLQEIRQIKQEKLAHLEKSAAIASDPSVQFSLRRQIDTTLAEIKALDEEIARRQNASSPELNVQINGNTQQVLIMIEGQLSTFTITDGDKLKAAISLLTGASVSQIKILRVEAGSIKITIEMPADAAERLIHAFENGAIPSHLNIIGVTMKQPATQSQPSAPKPGWGTRINNHPIAVAITIIAALATIFGVYIQSRPNTPTEVSYRGRIVNPQGEPVSGAIVTLTIGAETPITALTDGEGIYSFRFKLPKDPSDGKIIVRKAGFNPYDRIITLRSDQTQLEDILIEESAIRPPTTVTIPSPAVNDSILENLEEARTWPIIFSDTFDDNKNNWTIGSTNDDFASSASEIKDGKYFYTATAIKDPGAFAWNIPSHTPSVTDFYASVDIAYISGTVQTDAGLAIRMSGPLNAETAYFVYLKEEERNLVITRMYQGFTTLTQTPTNAININGTNTLEVIGKGSQFWIYVNGQFIVELSDTSLPSGTIDFLIRLPEKGATATYAFDNLEIRTP